MRRKHKSLDNLLRLCVLCSVVFCGVLSVQASHVRAYCFMASDSASVWEDANIRVSFVMLGREHQVTLEVENKTDFPLYLSPTETIASTNDDIWLPLPEGSPLRIEAGAKQRIATWLNMAQEMSSDVVDRGTYKKAFQWEPGHKGAFLNSHSQSRDKFRRGDSRSYTAYTTPLSLRAVVAYSMSRSMKNIYRASIRDYVSNIYIGKARKGDALDRKVPSDLAAMPYFYFDSGGCNPVAYVGGVTLMGTGCVVGFAALGVYLLIEAKAEIDE